MYIHYLFSRGDGLGVSQLAAPLLVSFPRPTLEGRRSVSVEDSEPSKTMENMGKSTPSGRLNGKILELHGGLSIAIFDYQREHDFSSFLAGS